MRVKGTRGKQIRSYIGLCACLSACSIPFPTGVFKTQLTPTDNSCDLSVSAPPAENITIADDYSVTLPTNNATVESSNDSHLEFITDPTATTINSATLSCAYTEQDDYTLLNHGGKLSGSVTATLTYSGTDATCPQACVIHYNIQTTQISS